MKERLKSLVVRVLVWEASRAIARWKPRIIVVSGSVGKTSTKDFIAAVLSKKYRVRRSEKSYNSEFGVPLAVLGEESGWGSAFRWLPILVRGFREVGRVDPPEVLVLEVGADHPGDVKRILAWLKPSVAVVTSFPDAPVHVEFFGSREALWDEDAEVIRALEADGLLVACGDDKNLARYLSWSKAPFVTYGVASLSTVRGSVITPYLREGKVAGMEMKVEHRSNALPLRLPGVLGPQLCASAIAGIAVGLQLGVSLIDAVTAAHETELPKGRMRLFAGKNGSIVVDDTYNSSPVALAAALAAVASAPTEGRRIAVLGDMRELGGYSVTEHRKAGLEAGNKMSMVVGVGESAREIVESAKGKKATRVEWVRTAEEAGALVASELKSGDIVLVKGSQGMRMERCSEMLLANPEDAKELPRQEREWRRR